MVIVKPFKGLKPKINLYPEVVSPPYDVVSYLDCKNIVKNNNNSLIHVARAEVDLPEGTNPYSETVYQKAKENLNNFIKNEILIYDEKKCFYIYKQIMGTHEQIGFVGVVSVYDYENGFVKKHENTRPDKELDRIRHIDITNCQTEPVFLAYRSEYDLNKILTDIEKTVPDINFKTNDGIIHIFWTIKDDKINKTIEEKFKNIPCLYVADGHHRTAAALSVAKKRDSTNKNSPDSEYKYFLSVIFPHDKLKIMPYNRVIKDLKNNNKEDFFSKIEKNFKISEIKSNDETNGFKPQKIKQIGMYFQNVWYLLEVKDSIISNDPVKGLDVSYLQDYILAPILGINDPRTDKRIEFIGGIKGTDILKNVVDSKEFVVSFSMFPTSMEELLDVADSNKLMPPKSTWFEPKLRSGMVLHNLG